MYIYGLYASSNTKTTFVSLFIAALQQSRSWFATGARGGGVWILPFSGICCSSHLLSSYWIINCFPFPYKIQCFMLDSVHEAYNIAPVKTTRSCGFSRPRTDRVFALVTRHTVYSNPGVDVVQTKTDDARPDDLLFYCNRSAHLLYSLRWTRQYLVNLCARLCRQSFT
jgi:hypothetical protein